MRRRAQSRGRARGPPERENPRSHRLDQDQAGLDGGLQTPPGLSACEEIKESQERVEKRNETGGNSFANPCLIFTRAGGGSNLPDAAPSRRGYAGIPPGERPARDRHGADRETSQPRYHLPRCEVTGHCKDWTRETTEQPVAS